MAISWLYSSGERREGKEEGGGGGLGDRRERVRQHDMYEYNWVRRITLCSCVLCTHTQLPVPC